jgi:hypothetical protein
MMNLVWAIDPDTCFETHWIHELFQDVQYGEFKMDALSPVIRNSVIIFNHSIDYKSLFNMYARLDVPYGVVHLSDETLEDDVSFYNDPQCKFVIRTYLHPVAFFNPKVLTIGLGYKKGFKRDNEYDTTPLERYYNWSFAGNIHDETRLNAIKPFMNTLPYKLHTTATGFNSPEGLDIHAYRDLMNDSRFVPCLIGQGNIDTFRFYEALEAGAIPVVIARTPQQPVIPSYWHGIFKDSELPFIIGDTWDTCVGMMQIMLQKKEKYIESVYACKMLWEQTKHKWRRRIAELCEAAFHLSGG